MNSHTRTTVRTPRIPREKRLGRRSHLNLLHLRMPLKSFVKKCEPQPKSKDTSLGLATKASPNLESMCLTSQVQKLGMDFDSSTSLSEVLEQSW